MGTMYKPIEEKEMNDGHMDENEALNVNHIKPNLRVSDLSQKHHSLFFNFNLKKSLFSILYLSLTAANGCGIGGYIINC